jgi:hypothetical protein
MLDIASTTALTKAATSLATEQTRKGVASLMGPVTSLFIAFLPARLKAKYLEGRLTVRELAAREDIFQKVAVAVADEIRKRTEKLGSSKAPATILKLQSEIDALEKRLAYLATVRLTVGRLGETPEGAIGLGQDPNDAAQTGNSTSPTWFDLFREIAERKCEPWRRELLAAAAKFEIEYPDSISLKTLWNLSLLDDHVFALFTTFLESAGYLDGYPAIIYDNDEQLIHATVDSERFGHTTLVLALTTLIEHGLVSNADFQLACDEPIRGLTKTRWFELVLKIPKRDSPVEASMRFSGYHCTDFGLDIARLCSTPILNKYSEMTLDSITDLLKDKDDVEIRSGAR